MNRDTPTIKDRLADKSDDSVYSATFIFRMKRADEKFNHFNDLIDEAAISNPGFLGKESWMNTEEDKQAVTYYWSSLEMLKKFSRHPDHQKAKQLYNKWYSGYEVLISEVLELKSDGGL